MAYNFTTIKSFTEKDDIVCFLERLEQYYKANGIREESKKVAVLLVTIAEEVYKVLKNLTHPTPPKDKTFEELKIALKLRYQKKISYFWKRITFDRLIQQENEDVASWHTRVRGTAAECNFGTMLEARVKDKFVTGMCPGPIQEKLCEQDITKGLPHLLNIALIKETILRELKESKYVYKLSSNKVECDAPLCKSNSSEEPVLKCIYCNPYGNPQYPPPQGQIYPQLYNQVNAPAPAPQQMQPGQPGYPYQGGQYQPGPGYPYQQGHQPAAMSYPNVTPMAPSAPPGPGFGYQGYPNVTPTPTYEPVVEWIHTTPNDAVHFTTRAVVAGYEGHDGSPLWVIRARYEGDLIPGKLAIKHNAAYVPWGGEENAVQNIEVCCARPEKIKWVESHNGVLPNNAIVSGSTKDGEPLYVGRAKQQGSLTPGKVHPSHKVLYISFAGQEIPHRVYEVMCTV